MQIPSDTPKDINMPRGYAKRGTKKYRQIKDLKAAKAILESNSLQEAYSKLHPNSTPYSSNKNAFRLVTPEVIENVRRILQLEKAGVATRENIEKLLFIVVAQYFQGDVKPADFLRSLELLSQLVPDFKQRLGVEDLTQLKPEELYARLRRYGVNPDTLLN